MGGVIAKTLPDGFVEVEGYGPGFYFKPILILDVKSGKQIKKKLDELEQHRDNQIRAVNRMCENDIYHASSELYSLLRKDGGIKAP